MSSKEFFLNRYEQLGWKYQEPQTRQAIRINTLYTKGKHLLQRLEGLGVNLKKIPFLPEGYWVVNSKVSVGAAAEYLLGYYSIQEAAAQIPATLFNGLKGRSMLDAAAAPGGKTTQMADLMENSGTIVALDTDKRRMNALANHLERCHVSNTVVYRLDARQASVLNLKFDRILLDVPCSGNFASDREWFLRRNLEDVDRNARVQKEILSQAAKCLAVDGEIVYSTCSLEPEEDELNMDWAVKNLDLQIQSINSYGEKGLTNVFGQKLDASVELCRRIWPGQTQGFFTCKLKQKETPP